MTHDTAAHALPAAYRAWRASTLGQITDRIEEDLLRELLGPAARLLAPLDPWLGRRTTAGAAFIAVRARRLDLDAEGG